MGSKESQNTQDTVTDAGKKKVCPTSPPADGITTPRIESEDYYKKLTKPQLEPLDTERDEKFAVAMEKKGIQIIEAEEKKHTAEDAYDLANRKAKTDLWLLNLQNNNKKKKFHGEYRKSLGDLLPNNYTPSGDTDIEDDDKVPKDQKTIKIVELQQKLAIEELDYLAKIQAIQRNESLAGNNWKQAGELYEADLCMASAMEEKAKLDAEVDWRNAISKALEETKQ